MVQKIIFTETITYNRSSLGILLILHLMVLANLYFQDIRSTQTLIFSANSLFHFLHQSQQSLRHVYFLQVSKYLFATTKKGTINEYKKLLYKKQYTHLKVLQLRYCGRDSIIQVRIDLIFIMVPLKEQKQNGGGTDI